MATILTRIVKEPPTDPFAVKLSSVGNIIDLEKFLDIPMVNVIEALDILIEAELLIPEHGLRELVWVPTMVRRTGAGSRFRPDYIYTPFLICSDLDTALKHKLVYGTL